MESTLNDGKKHGERDLWGLPTFCVGLSLCELCSV